MFYIYIYFEILEKYDGKKIIFFSKGLNEFSKICVRYLFSPFHEPFPLFSLHIFPSYFLSWSFIYLFIFFSSLLSLLFAFIITIVLEILTRATNPKGNTTAYEVFTKVFKHSPIFLIIERWIMRYYFSILVGKREKYFERKRG